MALLNHEAGGGVGDGPTSRAGRRLLLVLSCLAATGCALLQVLTPGAAQPFGFNHVVHAGEGLECGDCHAAWESDDAPGMPVRAACMLCHENLDAEKPPERRIDVLFDGDAYRAQRLSRLDDEIVFSHRQHATKPIECNVCHQGIDTSVYVDRSVALDMRDCESCHHEQRVAAECATCHRELRTDVAPASHAFQWQRVHGATVRAHEGGTADDCSLCHAESSCKDCHLATQPDNHDNYFRRRGHGLHARMDRQNCATCHRSDSCDACHDDTRPVSHFGAFGGTTSNHCVGCHLPVQQTECFTCHKGTPSHDTAAPKPADHTAGMNCRLCHGAGQPLPHVDNGSNCNSCHR